MKNKKVLIIGIITIIIMIIAILGILYFTTDLFKTEQQLFYKYLTQTEILNNGFVEQYRVANNKIVNNSNSSVTDISVFTSMPNEETGIADVQNMLSIKSNGLENTLTKQSYRDFTLSQNNQNLLTLKYMRDDNTYAIGADNILAKYLAVENANLKDLFTKLGVQDVSQIPDSIPTNYEDILKIDEETLAQLKATYGTLVYNNISKENFYKTTNEENTETISVSLSEQEVTNIIKMILETAKNDNVLLDLIVNKAQLLNYSNVTIENTQVFIQEHIDEITSQTYSTDKDFIKLSLTKKEKNVVGITIESNYIDTAEEYENPMDDGFAQTEQRMNNKIEIDFSEANKMVVILKENNVELLKGTISYSYDNDNIGLYTELESKENKETTTLKAQYQINNFQTDNITQNCVVDINSNDEEKYQVNINNSITLKQDVIISKLTTENSAKLNDMASEEITQLFTAIIARVMYLYGE